MGVDARCRLLPALLACSLAFSSPGAVAQPAPDTVREGGYTMTLEQLGARHPFTLRGVDGSDSVTFNLRADEVATGAKLQLEYAYSPALLSDLSYINVLLNNGIAAAIPLDRENAGKNLRQEIQLPPYLVTDSNELRLQLTGHYTLECEDPLHSSLWASIGNKSELQIAVERLNLPNDLAILPLPFVDHRDQRQLQLPFVFHANPSATGLEAAGMVASWLGSLAGDRGAAFPVQETGMLPAAGSAVVFIKGSQALPSLNAPAPAGPMLSMVPNPGDEKGKLLLVMGRDDAELKQAAMALVRSSSSLSGPTAQVERMDAAEPRLPYDAPRWLRTDGPVRLGQLANEQRLTTRGYTGGPVVIPLRVPPDLFGWRAKPVPMDLRYWYTPREGRVKSTLLVSNDDRFLRSFNLPSAEQLDGREERTVQDTDIGPMVRQQANVEIPLQLLLARSELRLTFKFDYLKEGECHDILLDDMVGRIDPESTVDLSAYPHFMPMPNLEAFSESGFPFTRLADLAETAVVLADNPTRHDISTYLAVMGKFGESTGYPALAITVAFGAKGLSLKGKDLVVIASGDQAWLSEWRPRMAAVHQGSTRSVVMAAAEDKRRDWAPLDPRTVERNRLTDLSYSSDGASAVFMGFESPAESGRSVVLISSEKPEGQGLAQRALLREPGYERPIQGSLAMVREKQVNILAQEYSYSVGELSLWTRIQWRLAQYWPGLADAF
ncbi:cellulose biosynthesis cyclic di-GMP-binding regulatory protein BcsB [Parapusillimonas sp. JC17]|uniref:cellulose biosynthesis cyclic di-GMP-binding regulatory protein BcsB n=1 Tax=Parapusillimonas sp. JC17 TaxID=3445768 RepID=UPI003F9F13A7